MLEYDLFRKVLPENVKVFPYPDNLRVIGFSGKKRAGKSTAAEAIKKHTPITFEVSFAGPMYHIFERLCIQVGMSHKRMHYYMTKGKEDVIPEFGTSCRSFLQTLGTEWGRHTIHKGLWVSMGMRYLTRMATFYMDRPILGIVDDVRFKNEVKAIRATGGRVIYVDRFSPKTHSFPVDKHASENAMFAEYADDLYINNFGSAKEFQSYVHLRMQEWYPSIFDQPRNQQEISK